MRRVATSAADQNKNKLLRCATTKERDSEKPRQIISYLAVGIFFATSTWSRVVAKSLWAQKKLWHVKKCASRKTWLKHRDFPTPLQMENSLLKKQYDPVFSREFCNKKWLFSSTSGWHAFKHDWWINLLSKGIRNVPFYSRSSCGQKSMWKPIWNEANPYFEQKITQMLHLLPWVTNSFLRMASHLHNSAIFLTFA